MPRKRNKNTTPARTPKKSGRAKVARKIDALITDARKRRDDRFIEAAQVWENLDEDAQMQVAAEAVTTRADELRLAYPDVLSIGYGLRTAETRAGRTVSDEVCLTFLVKRKPRLLPGHPGRRANLARGRRELPRFLWVYAQSGDRRAPCILPVDVEQSRDYRFKPQALSRKHVLATRQGLTPERGVLTCVVKLPGGGPTLYAVSCHHVLAMSLSGNQQGAPAVGAKVNHRVSQGVPGAVIGRLTSFRGSIRRGSEGESFDSALDEVTDPTALALAIPNPDELNGAIQDISQVRSFAEIIIPGPRIRVKRLKIWPRCTEIDYFGKDEDRPWQRNVVEWYPVADGMTVAGQSGSPVVNEDTRELMGMHIAGNEDNGHAYMLPATEVLDFGRYGGEGRLQLITSW